MIQHRLFNLVASLSLSALVIALPGVAAVAEQSSGSDTKARTSKVVSEDVSTVKSRQQQASDEALKAFRQAKETERLAKLRLFGEKAAAVRIEIIAKLRSRISDGTCKNLTATQKNETTAALAAIGAALEVKQQEIAYDTDLAKTKTDVEQIYSKNRVFATVVPAFNGVCLAGNLIALLDGRITEVVTKLKAAGKDTAALEVKVATTKEAAEAAYDTYLKILKSPGASDVAASFTSAKASMHTVRKTLGEIKTDISALKDSATKIPSLP